MLTKTSIVATQALAFMAEREPGTLFSPGGLAEALGQSKTYLAKVLNHLARVGILRSQRGSKGGVQIGKTADEITLLAVVEACQGAILADHCRSEQLGAMGCVFHETAEALQKAITGVLASRTIHDLAVPAGSRQARPGRPSCLMHRRSHLVPGVGTPPPGKAPGGRPSRV